MRRCVCGADNNFCGACGATLAAAADLGADAPAGFWTRFAAFAIDLALMILIAQFVGALSIIATLTAGALLDFIPYGRALQNQLAWMLSHYYVALAFVSVLYFTLGVSVWQTSIGKRVAGMRVVAEDGSAAGGGRALAGRALARAIVLVVSVFSVIGIIVSAIMIAARDDKRGLNDVICGTRVVRR